MADLPVAVTGRCRGLTPEIELRMFEVGVDLRDTDYCETDNHVA